MESAEKPGASEENSLSLELKAAALDPVVEVFKRDIDFTLVEKNLRLTTQERAQQLVNANRFLDKFGPLASGPDSKKPK